MPAQLQRMEKQYRNVLVLSGCQATLQTTGATMIAVTGLAGFALASDKSLATVPLTCYVLGSAITTIPASLLTECHTPAERAKTQAANDFMVFATMAISSASSGLLLNKSGWHAVNYGSIPFLVLAAAATLWLIWQRRIAKRRA